MSYDACAYIAGSCEPGGALPVFARHVGVAPLRGGAAHRGPGDHQRCRSGALVQYCYGRTGYHRPLPHTQSTTAGRGPDAAAVAPPEGPAHQSHTDGLADARTAHLETAGRPLDKRTDL